MADYKHRANIDAAKRGNNLPYSPSQDYWQTWELNNAQAEHRLNKEHSELVARENADYSFEYLSIKIRITSYGNSIIVSLLVLVPSLYFCIKYHGPEQIAATLLALGAIGFIVHYVRLIAKDYKLSKQVPKYKWEVPREKVVKRYPILLENGKFDGSHTHFEQQHWLNRSDLTFVITKKETGEVLDAEFISTDPMKVIAIVPGNIMNDTHTIIIIAQD